MCFYCIIVHWLIVWSTRCVWTLQVYIRIIILAIIPTTRQQCGGSCGGSVEIAVTQFGSVVIPCGNVVPSNNTRVNYCNGTSPLALDTDVLYNLTGAQIHQNGNILYCAPNMQNTIYCYRLDISCELFSIVIYSIHCNIMHSNRTFTLIVHW